MVLKESSFFVVDVMEVNVGNVFQSVKSALLKNRRLIGPLNESHEFIEHAIALVAFGLELFGVHPQGHHVRPLHDVELGFEVVDLITCPDQVETFLNQGQVFRVKLVCLDQDGLTYAQFAEVVEQRRVTNFPHFVVVKGDLPVFSSVCPVHHAGQFDGKG